MLQVAQALLQPRVQWGGRSYTGRRGFFFPRQTLQSIRESIQFVSDHIDAMPACRSSNPMI
jgi:hypothetical protein